MCCVFITYQATHCSIPGDIHFHTEKKKWQDRNADNIKRLLRKKDTQQLWSGIRMMTQVWTQRERVDPLRAREYFQGLLGKGVGEWGLRKDKDIFRPERRWEEELDRQKWKKFTII
jgi:hypothetical protein